MRRMLLALVLVVPATAKGEVIYDSTGTGGYSGSAVIGGFAGGVQGDYYELVTTNAGTVDLSSLSFAAAGTAPVTVTFNVGPTGSGFATSTTLGTVTPTATPTVYTLDASGPPIVILPHEHAWLGFTTQSASTTSVEWGLPATSVSSYQYYDGAFAGPLNQVIPAVTLVAPAVVPEPAPWLLGGLAALALAALRRLA